MKKLLSTASLLVCSSLVVLALRSSAPAQAAQAPQQGLEARVAALEENLQAEKKRHEETRALLEQTLAYLEKQGKASQVLLTSLDESEKQGFAVGENWASRQTLLAGFRAYWGDAQHGLPKLPAPAPAKPVAPARPVRQ
jgi:hypothetical protein